MWTAGPPFYSFLSITTILPLLGIEMNKENRIVLTKEKRDDMVKAIRTYFLTERGEEIGNLASGMILDFMVEELGPEFYNQGVMDAHKYLSERIDDVQSLLM
jgi:uncharacterized protein (DUF2164 family)